MFRGGVPWLSLMIFLPLLGAVLAAITPEGRDGRIQKWGTFLLSLAPLGIAIYLSATYQGGTAPGEPQQQLFDYAESLPWISVLGVNYTLGLDGISLPLVLLTTLMTPLAILASFNVTYRPAYFLALILLMETAILGVFMSLNFFLFFIFWEVSLIPGFFLISTWGRENRRYAAFKFFVYTMAGSVSMLLAFEFFYLATGTFDLVRLSRLAQGLPVAGLQGNLSDLVYAFMQRLGVVGVIGGSPNFYMGALFLGVFVALAVKLAVWPFHTWLPDAYSEAPTAASMLIAGVLTKMGAYAMLRLMMPIFPAQMQQAAPVLGFFAFMSIIVGAWVAYNIARVPERREGKLNDLKRVISYLSINHMGYVMLAIAAAGALSVAGDLNSRAIAINGAMMQMFAHGLSTGALFFLAGILAERTGSYELTAFGGLRMIVPVFAGLMGIAMFANLGLPGMAGFVGEFFIFRGTWPTLPALTIVSMVGLVISALALLLMYQRIFSGPVNERWRGLPDINLREWSVLLPLLALLIALGVYPLPLMSIANQTALAVVRFFVGA
ncbi:MAG: NADH-quinone oxidoreductase subunit M [Chloroflexi bacterium]|nr:NADH-quinone oxidoreductase subunit M [Chloroflexota bacterium]